MQDKEECVTSQFYYGDSVFKEVMQSIMDKAWIVRMTTFCNVQAEWEKLDLRVKNRKSKDLEEFRTGLKDLSQLYSSVWLKNTIKKCCGDLFDVRCALGHWRGRIRTSEEEGHRQASVLADLTVRIAPQAESRTAKANPPVSDRLRECRVDGVFSS